MAKKIYDPEGDLKQFKTVKESVQRQKKYVRDNEDKILQDGLPPSTEDFIEAGLPPNLDELPNFTQRGGYSTIQEKLANGMPINYSENGIFHTAIPLQTVHYKAAPNEKVIRNEGAYIVLGTDRPDSDRSGYGAEGATSANSIDIMVGRMASARGGKGPPGQSGEDGALVDNSFFADAARIHVSQLTDVDKNFGLAETSAPNSIARSAIGMKADAVRIIGREGIKIVTGRGDGPTGTGRGGEPNSRGGKIVQPAPSIDLIAGNNTGKIKVWGGLFRPVEEIDNLQPALKGYITRDSLLELSSVIDDILACIMTLTLSQVQFNSVLGIDPFRPHVPAGSVKATFDQLVFVANNVYQTRTTKAVWEWNYLYPFGYKYICSRNVNIT